MIELKLKDEHQKRYEEERRKKSDLKSRTFRPRFDSCPKKKYAPGPNNAAMLWQALLKENKEVAEFMDGI